jgi:hypothetical protein
LGQIHCGAADVASTEQATDSSPVAGATNGDINLSVKGDERETPYCGTVLALLARSHRKRTAATGTESVYTMVTLT